MAGTAVAKASASVFQAETESPPPLKKPKNENSSVTTPPINMTRLAIEILLPIVVTPSVTVVTRNVPRPGGGIAHTLSG